MDRQLRDAFVLSGDAERLLLDLASNLVEIDEPLVDMEELAPLLAVAGRVDQLEDERSARHDALAARQEIAPYDANSGVVFVRRQRVIEDRRRRRRGGGGGRRGCSVHLLFEYAGFACGLAADLTKGKQRD
jgi:hypothetical protein